MSKSRIFLIITVIFALEFIVWHKILNQVFLGEGYYYFDRSQDFFSKLGNLKPLEQTDLFARIIFDIIPPIFKDDIRLYQLFLLFTMATFHTTIFLVTSKITKSALLGFTATVFFLANYISSFGMTAAGQYQWFAERIPGLILVLVAFYYLERFFQQNKFRFYLISLTFFTIAVFLAHYSTFLLPIFVILPLVQFIGSKSKAKSIILGIALVLPFVTIGLKFNSLDGQKPKADPIKYILVQDKVFQKTTYQVAVVSLPPDFIELASGYWPGGGLSYPYTKAVATFTYLSLGGYFGAIFLVRKRGSRLTKLYLTSLLGMLSTMFLYAYVDVKLDVLKGIGQSRQFFPSAIFLFIIWAIILHSALYKKQRIYLAIILVLLTAHVVYNSTLINKHTDSIQYSSEMMRRFMAYTKSISNQFTSESIMVAPSYLGWPNPLIKLFYAPKGFQFALPLSGWEEEYQGQSKNVFVFDYDYQRERPSFDPEKGKVIDLTEKYRRGEKIKFLQ